MKPLVFLIAFSLAAYSQVAAEANRGYRTPEQRANITRNLTDPHRDQRQKPKELVQALNLKPGMTVADVGTGAGYMLPWLSKAVGPQGKVIAEDIFPDFLEAAKKTASKAKLQNVSFVLGTEKDVRLPKRCCDVVLSLDAYHHFDYPEQMVSSIGRSLRPGGRFVIVDFYKRPNAMPNGRATEHIRIDVDDVIKEVESFGWRLVSRGEHIPDSQYILTFQKR